MTGAVSSEEKGILKFQTKNQFSREDLEKKSIRLLEKIYDNVD